VASVTFGNGPLLGTATATLVGGAATFTNLADSSVGTIALGFSRGGLSDGGLSVGPTNNIVISPGAPAQLKIVTQPFASVIAGNTLTDPIVIAEEDAYGNVVTSDNSTVVTASLASGAGTLIGTTTATVVAGVASFNDLEDNTAGTLTLQFGAGKLAPAISNPSTVVPAAATKLKIVTQLPSGVIAGSAFGIQVDAYDPYNNLATSFNGPVTLGSGSGSAGTLSGTLTMTAVSGVATFNDLVATTSGSISLTAGSGKLTPATSEPINVTPAVTPTIIAEHINLAYLRHNKKGKGIGKPVVDFVVDYSAVMNPGTADNANNYHVDWYSTKKVKKKVQTGLHTVNVLSATSDASNTVVTLATSAIQKTFAKGGQITISGVTSQAGVLLSASDAVSTIQANAKGITPGD
jgi:hypothetical protein